MNTPKKITFDSFIRGALGGAIFIAILFILNRLSGVLLPFFIFYHNKNRKDLIMDRKTFNTIRNRFVIINKKIYNIINS